MIDLKKLVILTNFFLLGVLAVVFALLFQKNGDSNFLHYSLYCILFIGVSLTLFTTPYIFKAIKRFKPKKREATTNIIIKNATWRYFISNLPIPAVVFDRKYKILKENFEFQKLDKENSDEGEKYFDGLLELESGLLEKILNNAASNIGDFEVIEAKFGIEKNKNFMVFITSHENNKNEFVALLLDNSEKTELKEKFIQAQKMQGIGQLAGGIAHDFNNILTAIIGFSDLLLGRHSPEDSDYVDIMQIKQNANRAANLTRQLLAFSRRQTLQLELININDVVSETTELLRRLIGENIELDVKLEKSPWEIKADKAQLEQVIVNLVVNARDAMEGVQGSKLRITIQNAEILSQKDIEFKHPNYAISGELEPNKYIKICINDNGHGISKNNLSKIFEPFFTTKEVGKGTGLGLATVTGIVEQSGGIIGVSSAEKNGTEFIILLKKSTEESKKIEAVPEEKLVEKTQDLTGNASILLVEDEDAVRMFSARALKNKGYEVFEAFSGENALEVISEKGIENIDLIISDVVMPGISGPEMVKQALKIRSSLKVIFVSGYGEDVFYEQYGEDRKFNFLSKPYTLDQIAGRAKDVLAGNA